MVKVMSVFQVLADLSVDGRGGLEHVAYFTSKSEAEQIEQDKSSQHNYYCVIPMNLVIFDTAEEFNNQKPIEEIRKEALSKLTDAEKIVLGLEL